MIILILVLFGVCLFFLGMYAVVKAAVNNSELLKEIKVMLMKSQNSDR